MTIPSSDTRSTTLTGGGKLAAPVAWLLKHLPRQCAAGRLSITLPSGDVFESVSGSPGPHGRIAIKSWRGLWRMATGGNVGFAEAYMSGDCDCPDLAELFRWVLANDGLLGAFASGSAIARLRGSWLHRRNANTLDGSRRNVAAHYDLGNDFYAAWLDAGMSYSSAIFPDAGEPTLEQAQEIKLDRVVELLELAGGESVLEIGCGWGALAERLLGVAQVKLTGLTLSGQQLAYSRARLDGAVASGRADIRLQDYREVAGTFDRIVSIEMLEAVGQRYWPVYFKKLHECLTPGGIAVLQVITIKDARFALYAREPDFIQRYIFPGGMLPTVAFLKSDIAAAGLKLQSLELFGASYARTLAEWRRRFLAGWPRLAAMGFDERFSRMWSYYLTYCEAGFESGELDVGLYKIVKPAIGAAAGGP